MALSTPTKRAASSSELSPYAAKLPKFERTGSVIEDEKNKNNWLQLQAMINGCQSNPDIVSILFGKFTETRQLFTSVGEWQLAEMFQPTPKNLWALQDDFVYEFIISHSDLKTEYLVAIQRADPKGPHKLFLAMVQLPGSFKLEGDMVCRGFLNRMCHTRFEHCGGRMVKILEEGHVLNGIVFWANCGSYNGKFEGGKLVEVLHVSSGARVEINPLEIMVSEKWQMVDNWSDVNACYQYEGQPGMKLANLFRKDNHEGPWKYAYFTGSKQAAFLKFLDTELAEFRKDRERVAGTSAGLTVEIKENVSAMKAEKKKATMEKAKVAAKQALRAAQELRKAKSKPSPA
jgi:hypothetical protein